METEYMRHENRHIVAIDLGTSKIAITVALINGDDIQVVYYREHPSNGVKASAVYNPTRAAKQIGLAIKGAEDELGIKINRVVVNKPKYEVRVERAELKMDRDDAEEGIEYREIQELKTAAQEQYELSNPDNEILFGAVAQSYSIEDDFNINEEDVEGMTGGFIEGNFKVFIGNRKAVSNINAAFKKVGVEITHQYFVPDWTARAVLDRSELQNGVALVDIGAGATSVSIFSDNVLRHYASIPFGGLSVSTDIRSECQISDELAENIKLAFGICMPDKLANMGEKILRIKSSDPGIASKEVPVKYLSEVITARMREIIDAVLYEIERSGMADYLKAGIVLTGGGSSLANCRNLVQEMSGYKVRVGTTKPFFRVSECDNKIFGPGASASAGMILAAKDDEMVDCSFERVERPFVPAENVAESVPEAEESAEKIVEIAPGVFGQADAEAGATGVEEPATVWQEEPAAGESINEPVFEEVAGEVYTEDTVGEEVSEEMDLTPDNEKPEEEEKKPSFWEKMFGSFTEKEKKEEEKKPETKPEGNSKFSWKKILDKLDEAYDNIDKDNEV